ncbi:MAG: MauE/DoxX family redox-associated membrane protein [Flavobacteriales bacterium]|tara:strand:- start:294 stop:1199 length:906 start_codon:yes stop_codon:yes gene_type:complete
MKIAVIIMRISVGLMFVFSGLIKLDPIEIFELTFVDLGFVSWSGAPFVARFLISVEFLLGALLLFGVWQQKTIRASLVLMVLFSVYLIYLLVDKGNDVNCGCFGQGIPMTPIEALFKNGLFGAICIALILFDKVVETEKWKKALGVVLILLSIATPFILNPVQLSNNVHALVEPFELDITGIPKHFIGSDSMALNDGEVIVAFLRASCKHCKTAAYKLTIAQRKYDLPRVVAVFYGNEEKLPKFWAESNSDFPNVFFPNKRIYKITRGIFPTIMYMKDGLVMDHWTGSTFTYKEVEKLSRQ